MSLASGEIPGCEFWVTLASDGEKSSMYRVPRTVLPIAPEGVMVTGRSTVRPGPTTTALSGADKSVLFRHRSPLAEVTAGSNAAVVADREVLAVTGATPFVPSGPSWNGVMTQSPDATDDEL